MIGNSHQPRQQSYEDADEIQAGINQFQFHNIPLPQFSKVFERFLLFPHHIQSQDSVHHKITSQYIVIRITYGSSRDGAYH